jgi:uncharacterized protein
VSSSGIPGPLAVVTGASSGLGAIFAQRLGERGFNLLLTGRHPDRLEQARQRVIANARDCTITLLIAALVRLTRASCPACPNADVAAS